MQLRFLAKHPAPNNSPTLWAADEKKYVIQGFTPDKDAQIQVGEVQDGETVISVPEELMWFLPKEHDASPSPQPPDQAA
jgi:hypothetical protein